MGSFKSELNRFPPNTKQATHRTKQDTCYLTSRNSNSATVTPKTTMRKTQSLAPHHFVGRAKLCTLGGIKGEEGGAKKKGEEEAEKKEGVCGE